MFDCQIRHLARGVNLFAVRCQTPAFLVKHELEKLVDDVLVAIRINWFALFVDIILLNKNG